MKKTILFGAAMLLLPMAATGQNDRDASPPDKPKMSADMKEFMNRLAGFGFHGSVLVAKDGDVLLHEAYGLAQVHTGAKNTTETLFSTGSVTKQFTAAAIMYLQEKGKLSTSDPLAKYFDNLPEEKHGITLHHLLTHSAGLPPMSGDDYEAIARDDYVQRVFDRPLESTPGERYEYSNIGYSLLAAVVEKVSGTKYEEFLRDKLFLPSGMKNTGLEILDPDPKLVSHSHNADIGYPSPHDRPTDHWNLRGNGGILSTPMDMYRWMQAITKDKLFSASTRKLMFTPYVREGEEAESYYGYGWVVDEFEPGKTMIWHNGGAMPAGWGCAVYYLVDDDVTFIVFSNKPMDGMLPVDHVVRNLAKIMTGKPADAPPVTQTVDANALAGYVGVYAMADGGGLIVTATDEGLRIAPSGQDAMAALFPSPYARMLPKYNGKTEAFVRALAKGDIDTAVDQCRDGMATREKWKTMIGEWWASFDSLGTFEDVEVLGTKGGGGAQTYCRIRFTDGSAMCRFFWMMGKCEGIRSTSESPAAVFFPQSKTRFAGFNLAMGRTLTADFSADGMLTVSVGETTLEARRSD